MTSVVVLSAEERDAAEVVAEASRAELLTALCELPSYQRLAIRWLARAVVAQRPRPAGGPP